MSDTSFVQRFTSSKRSRRRIGLVVKYFISLILLAFSLLPVIWIISASINPVNTLATQTLIPRNASLDNYQKLLTENSFTAIYPYTRWFINSFKLASITTVISISITTLAAYAFSRFRFRFRQNMLKGILLVQVFPSLLAVVAIFLLLQQIGKVIPGLGLDTHSGLILVYLGGAMGINIWLMKGYFDSIPREIDESAMVDGATHWQIFTRLLLPLMRPIVIVVAILSFIFTYSDFILARTLLKTTNQYPLTVGLFIFTSDQFAQQWGVFAAGALMGALPIVLVYIILQDQIIGGLTQGSVKG